MSACQIIHEGKPFFFDTLEKAQTFLDQIPIPRGDIQIIGAPLLFHLMNDLGAPMYNWREINKEICNEWDQLFEKVNNEEDFFRTENKRIGLLGTFNAVMDVAEATIHPDDLEIFKDARDKQYKTFIYQESTVRGDICVETLDLVTQREIKAGRMPLNHSCRKLAEQAMAEPYLSRNDLLIENHDQPKRQSFINEGMVVKIINWFSRR
jgi:hypothetical protein